MAQLGSVNGSLTNGVVHRGQRKAIGWSSSVRGALGTHRSTRTLRNVSIHALKDINGEMALKQSGRGRIGTVHLRNGRKMTVVMSSADGLPIERKGENPIESVGEKLKQLVTPFSDPKANAKMLSLATGG